MTSAITPGSIIVDRFEIDELAGTGGMGAIYRATDRTTKGPVAIKVLHGAATSSVDMNRFLREAQVLAELRHPGIATHIAHGYMPDGRPFLAMELLCGEVLTGHLSRGPLGLARCLSVVRKVTDALAAAHRIGVVHRDIKPGNIFLCSSPPDRVVLLDFGIARHTLGADPLTRTGVIIGTPEYMAPEQARAERDIDPSADIFSLGCVLYECLTGRPPFVAQHIAGVLAKILFEESVPVDRLRVGVPAELGSLVAQMLDKNPARRPRNAVVLAEVLARLPALPHSSDEAATVTATAAEALTGSEQVLVSAVVASPRAGDRAAPPSGLPEVNLTISVQSALLADMERLGARVEWLADGSLVVAQSRESGSATDLVIAAARCALLIKERWPTAAIALATGRGVLSQHGVIGETIDRALKLLREQALSSDTPSGEPKSTSSAIFLDEVSAGLLDPRFLSVQTQGGAVLLGEHEITDASRLLIGKPTPCVGREHELSHLENLLSDCIRDSEAQVVLVTGPPGMGKSRLRYELLRRLGSHHPEVKVLPGRGDPLSAGSPYGIIGQALRSWFQIHGGAEPARQQGQLRSGVCARVGPSEGVHASAFLGELCGVPFPDEASIALRAARNDPKIMSEEIKRAFSRWLRAECEDGPVLLVLEDLHWGDPLSVKLIDVTARELSEKPLMVLALARPEVTDIFPKLWSDLAQAIPLRPLAKRACERLVNEVLGPKVGADTLERIVAHSEGNALYLEELIRAAAEGRGAELSETLLALLQARFLRLLPGARRVLRTASIFGLTFWTGSVQALYGRDDAEVSVWLRVLVEAEVVVQPRESHFSNDTEYVFRHALMREAAYSLLTDEDRRRGHRLASLYLESTGEADPAVIAEHAERGGDAERAVRFYLRAGKRAKAATAYQAAAGYLAAGMELLSEESWDQEYPICFELHAERAECEYLNSRFELAESLFEVILAHARSDMERAHVYGLRMILHATLGKMVETVRIGMTGLALFGVTFPEDEKEQEAAMSAALAEVSENLGQRRIEDLIHAPVITDPDQRTIMKLLSTVTAPAYFINPTFFTLIILKQVNRSLKYGHTEVSAFGYATYGMILTGIMGRYREAYAFGRLAMDLNEKFNNVDLKCKLSNVFGGFISYFIRPLRESLECFEQGNQAGLESGDFTFVSYNCLQFPVMRLGLGDELSSVREQCDELLALMQQTKDAYSTAFLVATRQMIENLAGRTRGRDSLSDGQFDEGEFAAEIEQVGLTTVVCWYSTIKLELAVLYEDYGVALQMAAKAEERAGNAVGFFFITELCFYTCLAVAALYPSASAEQQERYRAMLAPRQEKLATWTEHCAENFQHKHLLVAAEVARISGKKVEAAELYDQAIRLAQERGYQHHAALGNELAGRFHRAAGRTKLARMHLEEAYNGYRAWGAASKAAQMSEAYGALLMQREDEPPGG